MQVLVDTSIWVDYFRSGTNSSGLNILIDENLIVTNDIILTELVPSLRVKRQSKIVRLLNEIKKFPLQIDWDEIIQFQVKCLKSGVSGVGLPDLIIAQNSKQNSCKIYSLDSHFLMLQKIVGTRNYGY